MKSNLLVIMVCLLLANCPVNSQEISGGLINDTSKVVSGGLNNSGANTSLAWLGIDYEINDSLRFYADGVLQRGDNGSANTGAIQAYSNIDNDEAFSRLFEIWIEKEVSDLGLRFKMGQVDANSEFAYVEHTSEFLLDAMGFTPTISEMPTYPFPRLSFNAFWQASNTSNWSLGLYSDNSNEFNDVFSIGQWRKQLKDKQVILGAWHKTGAVEKLDRPGEQGSGKGYYASVSGRLDYSLFNAERAGWFSQFGYTNKHISAVHTHMSIGALWYGVHKRANNLFGAVVSHLRVNQPHTQVFDALTVNNSMQVSFAPTILTYPSKETVLEVFYRYSLNSYISFKPDLQYFISPASEANVSNAFVFTLRTEVSF